MEITESKIFEAFGLDASANNQDTAAPGETDSNPPAEDEGANGQDIADPAEREEPEADTPDDADKTEDSSAGETGDGTEPSEQTEEERRANARRRREQEQNQKIQEAVANALQQERARNNKAMEDFFRDAGLKNTITGEPITNMREFSAWKTAFDSAKLQQDLKSGKLTQKDIDRMVEENPAVKQANAILQQQRDEKMQSDIDAQLKAIHDMDPSISTVQDLLQMENYQEFYNLVKDSKMNFLQAYKLVNYDKLTTRKAQAARQQAMNNQRSKDHLAGPGAARGAGARTVPTDEMEMFRLFNPNATEADIIKYYNRQRG